MQDLSIDEIVTVIEDAFDASISPKSIQRVDNNKLHLMFKADAAGYQVIVKSALALKQRFDPLNCEDSDLPVLARITGKTMRDGKQSILAIVCVNTNALASSTLYAGTYRYDSLTGESFTFILATDVIFDPSESRTFYATSVDIGQYAVSDIASISVARSDAAAISGDFGFSCTENSSTLGYAAETSLEYRTRILAAATLDDDITEIENGILALPSIIECNCVFNALNETKVYDGITLQPKELLIMVTGAPGSDMAEVVAAHSHYATHMVNSGDVVYYNNARYIGGQYPVYFKRHEQYPYSLHVEYSYNSKQIKYTQVESQLLALLAKFITTSKHVDTITEKDMYDALTSSTISSVTILNATLYVSGSVVPYVSIPKTKIPKLVTPVVFVKDDTYEA